MACTVLLSLVTGAAIVPKRTAGSPERHLFPVECPTNPLPPKCTPDPSRCSRVVLDNFISAEEGASLRRIVDKGMAFSPAAAASGGPTIMDINSGFVRTSAGPMDNMHQPQAKGKTRVDISTAEYQLYGTVIERIKRTIQEEFGISQLHFTAPTFVTREVGNTAWHPKTMHDVYWHPHVDQNNTAHYHYSGLLYLADHGKDFEGGMFAFLDDVKDFKQPVPCFDEDIEAQGAGQSCAEYAGAGMCDRSLGEGITLAMMCPKACKTCSADQPEPQLEATELQVEPAMGRLVLFTSGSENLHQVKQVTSGTRLVMSMWFTCNEENQFSNFLDGKIHRRFGEEL